MDDSAISYIERFSDGANEHPGESDILHYFHSRWDKKYRDRLGEVAFLPHVDLKRQTSGHPDLDAAARVRNPDLFYWLRDKGPLLGLEITTHSPDGSNIDKRYPFLWASRSRGFHAFVLTPYAKMRSGGAVNRLPGRAAHHNNRLAGLWDTQNPKSRVQQILPIKELDPSGAAGLPDTLSDLLWTWERVGVFLADTTAQLLGDANDADVTSGLYEAKEALRNLAQACMSQARYVQPATLLKTASRWIQTYNARPETGWWERGEGQLDSIDGRVMFTLDDIELLPEKERPERMEFWMPSMTSRHPWIVEQESAGFGSKRLRNLIQLLPSTDLAVDYVMKFSDQLSADDWRVLASHPRLLLERLDAPAAEYELNVMVEDAEVERFAADCSSSRSLKSQIVQLLRNDGYYFSTSRPYDAVWQANLESRLALNAAKVYLPRIPRSRIRETGIQAQLVAAEDVPKALLLVIRQLHRIGAL